MKSRKSTFFIIVGVVILTALMAFFGAGSQIKGVQDMRFGIDIRGGVEAVFEPQGLDRKPEAKEMDMAREVIESRLDAQNILDREVTLDKKEGYLIVRFPWKSDEKGFDPEDSIAELGDMAKLNFKDSEGNVLLEGKNVKDSKPQKDEKTNQYVVALEFDSEGSKLFEEATEKLVGQQMGIYMDGSLISNPTVNEKISGGQAVINGMKDYDEAKSLSDKINSGALPFSMKTTNYSSISPTLGSDALEVMVMAGIIAFALVCLFMIFYYRLPGVISCIALVFQMSLQLLALSVPQYTVTLPGIAGIILSLGMAVDANVIISERISEEIKNGSSVRQAIKKGYQRAFSSVLDGNVTSAIVAVILMIFGSGAMLSFGYTLLVGLILNFAAGIFTTKHMMLSVTMNDRFKSEKWFRKKKDRKTIGFFKKRRFIFAFSCALLLGGAVFTAVKGVRLDTQFAGGAILKYSFKENTDTGKLEGAVKDALGRPVSSQVTTDPATKQKKLVLTLSGNKGLTPEDQKKALNALKKTSPDSEFKLSQSYAVEPYIGKKALQDSAIAIVLALLLITIYVWVRFSVLSGLSAGVMAVVALLHDMLMVFFMFVVFRIPLNDAFVAVTLTIIGYSINDTIVLYDRVRENKKQCPKEPLPQLMDESITQTLARSLNTSFTTVMCVVCILVCSVLYGIESIKVFSFPMLIGLITGCYSSICIAGPLWVCWRKFREKK